MKNIFQKIIERDLPASIVYESAQIIVIKDINPQAPIHYLIIPKEKFIDVSNIPKEKIEIISAMFLVAHELSQINPEHAEYKLVINNGEKAGQCIFHLHMHFLAGF
jgi:histidine triad (HIT) family protein